MLSPVVRANNDQFGSRKEIRLVIPLYIKKGLTATLLIRFDHCVWAAADIKFRTGVRAWLDYRSTVQRVDEGDFP